MFPIINFTSDYFSSQERAIVPRFSNPFHLSDKVRSPTLTSSQSPSNSVTVPTTPTASPSIVAVHSQSDLLLQEANANMATPPKINNAFFIVFKLLFFAPTLFKDFRTSPGRHYNRLPNSIYFLFFLDLTNAFCTVPLYAGSFKHSLIAASSAAALCDNSLYFLKASVPLALFF